MNRFTIAALAIVATLGWAAPASAQFFGGGPCDRGDLQQVAEKYIQAQRDGKPGDLPFGNEWVDYKENNQVSTMYSGGIIGKPQKIEHGYQVHIGPMYSDARGSVTITSRDPRVKPALRFNYLSTAQDRREWVEAIRVTRSILGAPAFKDFSLGEISPGPSVSTDEEILQWVAKDAETALHPSCTCRMGTDEMSVVDPLTMGVHGLDGLKVVDASVMPYVTNGNIYAPVMMTAEKAADLILGNTPLAPDPVEFYRYDRARNEA